MGNPIRRLSPWPWVLAGALSVALAGGQATNPVTGQILQVPLQPGQPYRQARERLLRAGWRLRKGGSTQDCGAVLKDMRCSLYPELGACSSTGAGFCRFQWSSPDGRNYAIITSGGTPEGEPGVVSHWFAEN